MKNKYNKILILIIILPLVILASCQIDGLDLQKPYKFEAGLKEGKLSMNALDFIKSRPDIFSSLLEAINYTGTQDLYTQPNNTYLLLTNNALSEPSNGNAYFVVNKVLNPAYIPGVSPKTDSVLVIASSWERYPKTVVEQFLRYHIVKGSYSYVNLNSTPTWFDSYADSDTTKVNMYLALDRYPYLYINNWTGSRYANLKPRSSNILGTNGYIQVMDQYIVPPTKLILASYGVLKK
jgi:hypothetical protein